MSTFIRADFYDKMQSVVAAVAPDHIKYPDSIRLADSRYAIDIMFEVMADLLCEGYPIRFKGLGKLTPYLKKGGRPVRNPRTREESIMPDRYVVTFSASTKLPGTFRKPLATSKFIARIRAAFERQCVREPAFMATIAVEVLHDMLTVARERQCRIEIRGLGVFSNRAFTREKVRNPKTNQLLEGDVTMYRTVFKESRVLRRRLEAELPLLAESLTE